MNLTQKIIIEDANGTELRVEFDTDAEQNATLLIGLDGTLGLDVTDESALRGLDRLIELLSAVRAEGHEVGMKKRVTERRARREADVRNWGSGLASGVDHQLSE